MLKLHRVDLHLPVFSDALESRLVCKLGCIFMQSYQYLFICVLQNSGTTAHEVPDDKSLIGFAHLSIIDSADPETAVDSRL